MPQYRGVATLRPCCPPEAWMDSGKPQGEHPKNIGKCGKTKAGRQRHLCRTCGRTFTETKGTIFYRRRTPENEIIETLALWAEGNRIGNLARVKGHKEDTILDWLRDAAQHAEAMEEELLARYRIQRGQRETIHPA